MGCQNTKVVAENVEIESKQHIMISYSWESGQKTDFSSCYHEVPKKFGPKWPILTIS